MASSPNFLAGLEEFLLINSVYVIHAHVVVGKRKDMTRSYEKNRHLERVHVALIGGRITQREEVWTGAKA